MRHYVVLSSVAIVIALAAAGCGGATKTVTETSHATAASAASPVTKTVTETSHATTAAASSSQNDQVISQASQAPDNQAQLGAAGVSKILTQKLGMNDTESFNLNHRIAPGDDGGGCYVKLGADAVNFESSTGNILRSPNGNDLVFVQSNTATPLVKCLEAVRSALGW